MTPIYFPFTWADAPTIQAITAVFPKIAIYQPSVCRAPSLLHPFEQAGKLEIRVPVTEDCQKLEMMVADFQSWARLHQGSDLAFLKTRQPAAPFIDHLSSRIQSDILNYQDSPTNPAPDPVFNARLFLEIAAAYDAQQSDLSCDLAKIQNLEKRFMAALGDHADMEESVPLGNLPLFQDDPGTFMLAERLQAWSILFLQDLKQRTAGDLWVTSRLSVVEWIRDEADMEPVLEINCIPIQKNFDDNTRFWQESIMVYLSQLQTTPWPTAIKKFEPPSSDYAWENAVSVKGFIIPNLTPDALLQKMAADKAVRMPDSGQLRHTIVVCVSPI
ncbi:MAG: hypothetical protein NTU74_10900 [Deltaproteobacteria bacterium]|nr:hypothetical protein [Deltaproteobacteria bacterium]